MVRKNYWEAVDFVLSEIITASSNIRSASLIAPTGMLRRFKVRNDVTLLLNTMEMGELVKTANAAASSFYKFSRKLGEVQHMYLDFDNLQAVIFPMPDHNILLVTVEKMERDIPIMILFIKRLLHQQGMIHAT